MNAGDYSLFSGRFSGRTALITGASGGLGSEVAVAFTSAGAKVALQYRSKPPEFAINKIQSIGAEHRAIQADFNNPGTAKQLMDELENTIGIPGILVNCAAAQDVSQINNISEQDFDHLMKTNVNALFNLSTEFARHNHASASIINISSIEASRPSSGHAHYAVSKAAVEMLTKSLALEYGPRGIRTNTIAPGLIERDGIREDWPQGVESWEKNCPLGRMAKPGDIANACLFLASDEAAFINGATLTVDGGMLSTPGW